MQSIKVLLLIKLLTLHSLLVLSASQDFDFFYFVQQVYTPFQFHSIFVLIPFTIIWIKRFFSGQDHTVTRNKVVATQAPENRNQTSESMDFGLIETMAPIPPIATLAPLSMHPRWFFYQFFWSLVWICYTRHDKIINKYFIIRTSRVFNYVFSIWLDVTKSFPSDWMSLKKL